jgi:peptidoglycan/LPS O-acetylase OafA/YrhL
MRVRTDSAGHQCAPGVFGDRCRRLPLPVPGFAGGFVGVDVFLVITGYLMTAKILNKLKLDRFSPWTFWMMRMRRIFPALAVS